MSLVADASVAAKWFIKEADREKASRVLDATERHAPRSHRRAADRRLLAAVGDHALAALVVHLDDVAW